MHRRQESYSKASLIQLLAIHTCLWKPILCFFESCGWDAVTASQSSFLVQMLRCLLVEWKVSHLFFCTCTYYNDDLMEFMFHEIVRQNLEIFCCTEEQNLEWLFNFDVLAKICLRKPGKEGKNDDLISFFFQIFPALLGSFSIPELYLKKCTLRSGSGLHEFMVSCKPMRAGHGYMHATIIKIVFIHWILKTCFIHECL